MSSFVKYGMLIGCIGALSIITILIIPAYADPVVKTTSAGTINVSFATDPSIPIPGDQTQLKISFINKQDKTQQPHVDYKVSVMQGSNQVFGTPVLHTAEGAISIPYQFQSNGTYQVIVEVEGLVFQPIPPETATFTVDIGSGSSGNNVTVPEFGQIVTVILVIATTSSIVLSKKRFQG